MRKELDEALCAKYPLIFKDRDKPMTETAMCWGFSHGDGWYNIIDTLCGLLYSDYRHAKDRYESIKGYYENGGRYPWVGGKEITAEEVEARRLAMVEAEKTVPIASQVKEKFGGLRFYVNGGTEKHWNYITFAESMSYKTCEECGKPGTYYPFGWHHVACDDHASEEDKENLKESQNEDVDA